MRKVWSDEAWEDYTYWQTQDKKTLKKINRLIQSIDRNGYDCEGKPEPLSGDLAGFWSVRIDQKNRIVFRITEDELEIWQCGSHYHHDDKLVINGPMDEVLKDADVIHHCMNDLSKEIKEKERVRFEELCMEFGM